MTLKRCRRGGWWAGMIVAALAAAIFGRVGLTTGETGPGQGKQTARIEALFSPGDNCERRLVDAIESAENTIRAQVYLFTSKPIAEALAAAAKRGVKVQVILDKSQEKMTYGRWPVLRRAGVQVYFDRDHEVMNTKILIVDRRLVTTGSYNFTKAAEEKNAENIIVIEDDEELADKFVANFEKHLGHSHRASE